MAIIYVRLLDEDVGVWRPVEAEALESGLYRLLQSTVYDPTIEKWEFLPGALVRCETKRFDTGSGLVAVAEVFGA